MTHPVDFAAALAAERVRERPRAVTAILAALAAAASAVLLLGVSGAFLAGAAAAGLGGAAAVVGFNYLLPSAAVRAFAILRTGGKYAERYLGHGAALASSGRIRALVFERIAGADARSALKLSGGVAASRLIADVGAIETALVGRTSPFAAAGAAVAGLVCAAVAGPGPACALLAALALEALLARTIVARRLHPARVRALDAGLELKETANVLARAAPELVVYGFGDRAAALMAPAEAKLAEARTALARTEALLLALPLCLAAAYCALIIVIVPPGQAVRLAAAALAGIAALEGAAGIARDFERRRLETEALDRLEGLPTPEPGGGDAPAAEARLRIAAGAQVMDLPPGGRLLIAGPSGSGKTRLLETLLRFRADEAGAITVDGRPLSAASIAAARALFAYAPQNAAVLSATVWENLTLGDAGVAPADAWAALEDAGLLERVRQSSTGLSTPIGDHGEMLSGGERKRLGLARAYLKPAAFLMLDEPTEGLDAATEALVVERLERRLARTGQGLILVSHRTAPQALCDLRLVVGGAPSRARGP